MKLPPNPLRTSTGEYRVVRSIGEGGSAIVFEATDDDGVSVAIKVFKPVAQARQKLKRFRNELYFSLQNRDPDLIRVLDHGLVTTDQGETAFYVMPLYPQTLRSLLDSRPDPIKAYAICLKILQCVEAAHLRGVSHRDLKPENFLYDPHTDTLVLSDFGIARFQKEALLTAVDTSPGMRLANFEYSAPEQRRPGMTVGRQADMFALGLMFGEIFTGQVRQGAGHKKIADSAPQFAFLDDIVDWLLQQEPGARPESIDAIRLRLMSLEQEAGSRQKLDVIENTVVPVTQSDDPLVSDPPRLVGVDYREPVLTLTISTAISVEWVAVFKNINIGETLNGAGVRDFGWNAKQSTLNVPQFISNPTDLQQVVDDFKRMLEAANRLYAERLTAYLREREEALRRELITAAASERKRLEILKNIRI